GLLGSNLALASLQASSHTAAVLQQSGAVSNAIGARRGILVCNSTAAIGVLGLRFFGIYALSSLPVLTSPPTSVSQIFPHLSDGTEWQTEFLLINTSPSAISVQLKFHLDGGVQTLPIEGMGPQSSISNIMIAPNGSALFRTVGSPQSPLVTGWVEVVS